MISILGHNPILYWSASNALKFTISERYFGSHYVWCSPVFDAKAVGRLLPGAKQPQSSDPASIYKTLHKDVSDGDRHSSAIAQARDSLKAAAATLLGTGTIDADQAAEVFAIVDDAEIAEFRPLIYAIPAAVLGARASLVPYAKRASAEPEYVIDKLHSHEFHVIEPSACL